MRMRSADWLEDAHVSGIDCSTIGNLTMLSLTRKTDYALVALAYLGHRHSTETGPASARLIADTYGLPLPLLMNILKELSSAGLLTSTRGATGGYMIAVSPAEISVLKVVEAIEGPMRIALCADENAPAVCNCNIQDDCPIRNPVRKLHFKVAELFGNTSLEDLINESNFEQAEASAPCKAGQNGEAATCSENQCEQSTEVENDSITVPK
ncbi:Rrf2 family transcriptional regulator [Planctomycetota bacterium]|nr:Rrf2 family transcriptional regulator [Planctomycetota bacterium]